MFLEVWQRCFYNLKLQLRDEWLALNTPQKYMTNKTDIQTQRYINIRSLYGKY